MLPYMNIRLRESYSTSEEDYDIPFKIHYVYRNDFNQIEITQIQCILSIDGLVIHQACKGYEKKINLNNIKIYKKNRKILFNEKEKKIIRKEIHKNIIQDNELYVSLKYLSFNDIYPEKYRKISNKVKII